MRAARFHGREDIRLEEVPEPDPGPGEVKLRVLYAGICGTDVHEYYNGPLFTPGTVPHPLSGVTNPVILGHEMSGEVVEVGSGVTGVNVGDLVAVEPLADMRDMPLLPLGVVQPLSNPSRPRALAGRRGVLGAHDRDGADGAPPAARDRSRAGERSSSP